MSSEESRSVWENTTLFTQTDAAGNHSKTEYGRDEQLAKIEITVLGICLALAVFGNVCVLVALICRRKKVTRMHLFIMHLSIADILVALFNLLPQLLWDINHRFLAIDILCRFIKFMQMFVLYLSTYVLIMTAIDRYRAICHPLSNQTWTPRMVYAMVVFAYVISVIFSIPQLFWFKYREITRGSNVYDCWATFEPTWILEAYTLYVTLVLYIIPLIILCFAYGRICYTIWVKYKMTKEGCVHKSYRQEVEYQPSTRRVEVKLRANSGIYPRTHSLRGFSRAKLKTIKLTFVVIVAYIVCWSPFFVSQLWWLYDKDAPAENQALAVILLLGSLNSCCNPWIYLAFSGSLLQALIPCKRRMSRRQQAQSSNKVSMNSTREHPIEMKAVRKFKRMDSSGSSNTQLTLLRNSSMSASRKSGRFIPPEEGPRSPHVNKRALVRQQTSETVRKANAQGIHV